MRKTPSLQDDLLKTFSGACVGLPVALVWRGYGSAIFLEFGDLHDQKNRDGTLRRRRDGSLCNKRGDFSLMIEWSWRVETDRTILCGSWGNEKRWPRVFRVLTGNRLSSVRLFGELPEICVELSNKTRLLSFNTSEGDPQWVFFDRRHGKIRWIKVRRGRLNIEESADVFAGTA